jgi:hypothetical protein
VVKIPKDGYEEPLRIPKAGSEVVSAAVRETVEGGRLWLSIGPTSIYAEEIPEGLLTDEAMLEGPPTSVPPKDILPESLPEAWRDGSSDALTISDALSKRAGRPLPWKVVRDTIDGALRARLLERTLDSGQWPCAYSSAVLVTLRLPENVGGGSTPGPLPLPPRPGVLIGEAELRSNELQDLADVVGELIEATAGYPLKFQMRIELEAPEDVVEKVNKIVQGVSEELRLK